MYAPAPEYINMLGVSSDFQKLPGQFVLNGKIAPLSLLAVGPDRYTGKSIYYLNITATLDFLGINYNMFKQDSKVQIMVNKSLSQPTAVTAGSVSGQVISNSPFQEGTVTLSEEYINDARIPSTRVINSAKLSSDGKYSFTGLSHGKYVVKAVCIFRSQSDILYNQVTKNFYYIIKIAETTYIESLSLAAGENVTLNLNNGKTIVSEQINYVNTPYYLTPCPNP
jgi:hypothetical protein